MSRSWFASTISAAVLVAASAASAAPACAPASAGDPADAPRRMYAAAMKLDRAGMLKEFAPGFYAFDGGKRYSASELADVPQLIHDMGKTYAWSVTEPDVHMACDTAWATWTNRGSITDASGTQEAVWLESAVLVWRDGAWKLSFFQSTPVPRAAH